MPKEERYARHVRWASGVMDFAEPVFLGVLCLGCAMMLGGTAFVFDLIKLRYREAVRRARNAPGRADTKEVLHAQRPPAFH